jgi:hypothetical protein
MDRLCATRFRCERIPSSPASGRGGGLPGFIGWLATAVLPLLAPLVLHASEQASSSAIVVADEGSRVWLKPNTGRAWSPLTSLVDTVQAGDSLWVSAGFAELFYWSGLRVPMTYRQRVRVSPPARRSGALEARGALGAAFQAVVHLLRVNPEWSISKQMVLEAGREAPATQGAVQHLMEPLGWQRPSSGPDDSLLRILGADTLWMLLPSTQALRWPVSLQSERGLEAQVLIFPSIPQPGCPRTGDPVLYDRVMESALRFPVARGHLQPGAVYRVEAYLLAGRGTYAGCVRVATDAEAWLVAAQVEVLRREYGVSYRTGPAADLLVASLLASLGYRHDALLLLDQVLAEQPGDTSATRLRRVIAANGGLLYPTP